MHSSLQLPCQLQYMREGKRDILARGFTLVVFSGAVCASTLAGGACTFGRASILSVSYTLNLRGGLRAGGLLLILIGAVHA